MSESGKDQDSDQEKSISEESIGSEAPIKTANEIDQKSNESEPIDSNNGESRYPEIENIPEQPVKPDPPKVPDNVQQPQNPAPAEPAGSLLSQPADLELSKTHGNAQKVYKFDEDYFKSSERCPCCNFPSDGNKFPLCAALDSLNQLGAGFPLYFWFLRYSLGAVFILFSIAGIACLIGNIVADKHEQWKDSSTVTILTPANYGNPYLSDSERMEYGYGDWEAVPMWQSLLHLFAGIALMIYYPWIDKKTKERAVEIDIDLTTPSDFTLWVKGLPKSYTKEELSEHFRKNGNDENTNIEIVNIVLTHDIKLFTKITRELVWWKIRESYLREYQHFYPGSFPERKSCGCIKKKTITLEDCAEKIQELTEKQQELLSMLNSGNLAPSAFITFRTQQQTRGVDNKWNRSNLQQLFDRFLNCFRRNHLTKFKGCYLTASLAPEPTDVFWENLSRTTSERIIKRFQTWIISAIAIFVTFITIYFINDYQQSMYDDQKDSDHSSNGTKTASVFLSLLVVFINFVLGRLIRIFSAHESHQTWTLFNVSVADMLILSMSINTGLIPIILTSEHAERWFIPGGLATQMTYILIINACLAPIINFISPMYCLKVIRRFFVRRSMEKGKLKMSQGDANVLFEGPQIDLAVRYANVIKTLIVTFFYAPLIPIGIPISFFGITFEYLVTKYMLLRKYTRPKEHNAELAFEMNEWLKWVAFSHALGVIIFYYNFPDSNSDPAKLLIAAACLYIILPLKALGHALCKYDSNSILKRILAENDPKNDYFKQLPLFYTDYERENPITHDEGWRKWNEFMKIENKEKTNIADTFNNYVARRAPCEAFVNVLLGNNVGGNRGNPDEMYRNMAYGVRRAIPGLENGAQPTVGQFTRLFSPQNTAGGVLVSNKHVDPTQIQYQGNQPNPIQYQVPLGYQSYPQSYPGYQYPVQSQISIPQQPPAMMPPQPQYSQGYPGVQYDPRFSQPYYLYQNSTNYNPEYRPPNDI
ncbi:unnamed protein product [Blepharisma stoltei]|uniref:CSC1/OSCA1-like cytosolic domain-containing protein n=1 Tax=Blepharisma stoltei TaxID=1481888 RepID=A0AAU9JVS4_9CILI|nr:unnamed protein product [Blepharisma stoltei]